MEEYHLAEQIGEGSFGKVFKARRRYTSQIVAVKLMNKHGKSEKDMRSLRQVCHNRFSLGTHAPHSSRVYRHPQPCASTLTDFRATGN